MRDTSQFTGQSRHAGRSTAVTAFVLALVVVAVIIAIKFLPFGRPDGAGGGPVEGDRAGATGAAPVESAAVADPAGDAEAGASSPAETPPGETSVTAIEDGTIVIAGVVTSESAEPIEGAIARWIDADSDDLEPLAHDGAVLGSTVDLEHIEDDPLRQAFERAVAAETDVAGAFELRVPERRGSVMVSAAGYRTTIRSVADANAPNAGVQETAEVPEADEEQEPAGAVEDSAPVTGGPVELRFTLEPAGSISGRVTDAQTGEPATGMIVTASRIEPDRPAFLSAVDGDAPRARTDDNGDYVLRGLPLGEYRVAPRTGETDYASIPSRDGRVVVLEEGVDVIDVDFDVTRGGVITGVVVDPAGEPVALARCVTLPTDVMERAMRGDIEFLALLDDRAATTDNAGAFEFRGLPLGVTYRVHAHIEGFARARSEPVELTAEHPVAEIGLRLTRGYSISGRVVHASGGVTADVEVRAGSPLESFFTGGFDASVADPVKTRTDEQGEFRLEHLGDGEYALSAGEVDVPTFPFGDEDATQTRVTVQGADVTGVVVTLGPPPGGGVRVTGTVRGNDGTPLAGATVKVASMTDIVMLSTDEASTDENGRFAVATSKTGPFRVRASRDGYADSAVENVAPEVPVDIVLEQHGRLSGRVVTSAGTAPGAGGRVTAQPVDAPPNFQQAMLGLGDGSAGGPVAPDGVFSLEAPAGRVEVRVLVPGFAPASSAAIDLAPGEHEDDIEIVISVGAVLHGKITAPGSVAGASGARVRVELVTDDPTAVFARMMPQLFGSARNSVMTDDDGQWEIAHLEAGVYAVTASHDEHAPSGTLEVTVARDEVRPVRTIALSVPASVSGRILDEGKPVGGMTVQLMSVTSPLAQKPSNTDGTFEFTGLRAGEYMLSVLDMKAMMSGRMKSKTRHLVLEAGVTHQVTIEFGKGHLVHGKITGALPAGPFNMVTLRRPGGKPPEELNPLDPVDSIEAAKYQGGVGFVTGDGYEIPDVEPGTYIIEIPRMPSDPTDLQSYQKMQDRSPLYRARLEIQDKDVEHDISLDSR